jgi:hypothetical protein
LGLPYNMAPHSLQRSQYVNGLSELSSNQRQKLFGATAELVRGHYCGETNHNNGNAAGVADYSGFQGGNSNKGANNISEGLVPWFPYNFHAGNFYDADSNYSPQDLSTGELIRAGITPLPTWVFSPHFSLSQLGEWTKRQIELFSKEGRKCQQIRIKNPGQGVDWTAESIWAHCQAMRKEFKNAGLDDPLIYIHNHDFNGEG